MNRIIKFRAWNMEKKEFEYYEGIHSIPSVQFMNLRQPDQFTGLKDKDGKEIYEGDVLTDNYVVRYENDCFVIQLSKSETASVWWLLHQRPELEVIGNIYENPDLLV